MLIIYYCFHYEKWVHARAKYLSAAAPSLQRVAPREIKNPNTFWGYLQLFAFCPPWWSPRTRWPWGSAARRQDLLRASALQHKYHPNTEVPGQELKWKAREYTHAEQKQQWQAQTKEAVCPKKVIKVWNITQKLPKYLPCIPPRGLCCIESPFTLAHWQKGVRVFKTYFPICWDPKSFISLKKQLRTSCIASFPTCLSSWFFLFQFWIWPTKCCYPMEGTISKLMFWQILITLCKLVIRNQNSHHWFHGCCWVGFVKLSEKY